MNPVYELTMQLSETKQVAQAHLEAGELERAIAALEQVMALARQLGDYKHELLSHLEILQAERARGQLDAARAAWEAGLAVAEAHGLDEMVIRFGFEHARTEWLAGRRDQSIEVLEQASGQAERLTGRGPELVVKHELARRYFEAGQHERAVELASWVYRLALSTQSPEQGLQAAYLRVEALQALQRFDEAQDVAAQVEQAIDGVGGSSLVQFLLKRAEVAQGQGDETRRREFLERLAEMIGEGDGAILEPLVEQAIAALKTAGLEAVADRVERQHAERTDDLKNALQRLVACREEAGEQFARGKLVAARDLLSEALRMASALEDAGAVIDIHKSIAVVAERQGDNHAAMTHLSQASALCARTQDIQRSAEVMYEFGRVRFLTGDHHGAIGTLRDVERLMRQLGNDHGLAQTLLITGAILSRLELFPEAQRAFEEVSRLAGDDAALRLQAEYESACVLRGRARLGEAKEALQRVLERASEAGLEDVRATAMAQLGDVFRALGDRDAALDTLGQARALAEANGDRRLQCFVDHWRGLLLLDEDKGRAAELLRAAWFGLRELGAGDSELLRFKLAAEEASEATSP